jgi:hypothetical protein
MSFTGQNIIDTAEYYTEVTPTDINAKNIINRGLNRLSTIGAAFGEEAVSVGGDVTDDVAADNYFSLTDDIVNILFVIDENNNSFERWEYNTSGQIKFAEEGNYIVVYRKIVTNITDLSSDIDLKDTYQEPLVKHFEGLIKLKYNDTSPDGGRLMAEFERLATQAFNILVFSRLPGEIRASEVLLNIATGGG